MSGGEVIGLVSGIIAIVEASLKVYNAAADASGLPSSFRNVATRLPIIHDTLAAALAGLTDDPPSPEGSAAIKSVLQGCGEKAAALEKIFRAVIPAPDSSRAERYRKALKTLPSADKVDSLMGGILSDLQMLVANHAVKAPTRAQMERLIAAASVDPDRRVGTPSMSFRNTGTGSQIVHSERGDQIVNIRSGPQFHGDMTGGVFNFSS
ncbi:hypothetical protein B0T10DRAFT_545511 [Thelonectria olida]|uniref:NACHT-NTPase and P-loop NTPases N-terminal domain-containing protein n=1 Tax=Thelonectria olida TaxID=1576542 RepID=A0A9P9AWK5_9HYPO|nr:hypothetical protein B0T10DRAFT_545511 [Thelonectria olida]